MNYSLLASCKFKKGVVFKMLLGISIITLLFTGCGESSSDDPKKTDKPSANNPGDKNNPSDKSKPYGQHIQYAVASQNNQSKEASDMKKSQSSVNNAMQRINPESEIALKPMDALEGFDADEWAKLSDNMTNLFALDFRRMANDFTCGNGAMQVAGKDGTLSVKFNFDGSCDAVRGSQSIAIEAGKGVRFEFSDFGNSDCTINGGYSIRYFSHNGSGGFTGIRREFENFTTCDGDTLNGHYGIYKDNSGDLILDFGNLKHTYKDDGNVVTVNTDGLTENANGVKNGSISVQIDDGDIELMTMKDLSINSKCGIPTSGHLVIENGEGNSIDVDFAHTTCDNPKVSYTVGGKAHSLTLRVDDLPKPEPKPEPGQDPKPKPKPKSPANLLGTWQGSLSMSNNDPQNLHIMFLENGRCQIEIDAADGFHDEMLDDDVIFSIDGSKIKLVAEFEDLSGDNVVYIFRGTVEDNVYKGKIAQDDSGNTGTFQVSLTED